jgi:type IV pilus assembly protein PilM
MSKLGDNGGTPPSSVLLMDVITDESRVGNAPVSEPDNGHSDSSSAQNFVRRIVASGGETDAVFQSLLPSQCVEDTSSMDDMPVRAGTLSLLQRFCAKKYVGLEIASRSIRASQLLVTASSVEVMRLLEEPLPDGKEHDTMVRGEYVKAIGRRLNLRDSEVILVIAGTDVNLRLLKMPKVSKKEIRDALLWKNKKELHFFNDAPTVLHYVILDDGQSHASEFHVLVIAVKEEVIKEYLDVLEYARVRPAKMVIKAVAQWNAYRRLPVTATNSLLIDIGYHSTHLCFFRQDTLQFAREIPIGGNHFTSALTQTIFFDNRSFSLSWTEAEAIKRDMGLLMEPVAGKTAHGIPLSEISVMMRPVAERLAAEISMSIAYYKENFRDVTFDRVYLTGNSSRLKHLPAFLRSHLGYELEGFSLASALMLGPQAADHQPLNLTSHFNTIGAALSAGAEYNFLPEPVIKDNRFRRAVSWLLNIGLSLLLCLATATLLMLLSLRSARTVRAELERSLQQVKTQSQEYSRLVDHKRRLTAAEQRLTKELPADSTVGRILLLLSNVTPEEIALTELRWGDSYNATELNRQQTDIRMRKNGAIAEAQPAPDALWINGLVYQDVFFADIYLLNFIHALESSRFFREVNLRQKRREEGDETLYFELQCMR